MANIADQLNATWKRLPRYVGIFDFVLKWIKHGNIFIALSAES